jgi:hypothetical protein
MERATATGQTETKLLQKMNELKILLKEYFELEKDLLFA